MDCPRDKTFAPVHEHGPVYTVKSPTKRTRKKKKSKQKDKLIFFFILIVLWNKKNTVIVLFGSDKKKIRVLAVTVIITI